MILSHEYRRNTGTFTGILVPVAGIHPLYSVKGVDEYRQHYRHHGDYRRYYRRNTGTRETGK